MASPPPPKDPKRQHIHQVIRHSYDRFKHTVQLSPRPSSRNSGNSAAPLASTVARSPSTASSTAPSQSIATQPVVPQGVCAAGNSMLGTSPAFITVKSVPVGLKPTTTNKFRDARGVTWSGLETALRVLERSADAFPPLKSAVGGVVACLDVIQSATKNAEDYEQLTSELTTMAVTLSQYLRELGSEDPSGSASRIVLSIDAEVAHIGKQQNRGKGRQVIESLQDKDDVIKRYHRIEGLFRQLQNDMVLRIWRNTNEQYVTALLRGMSPIDDARYNSSYSTTTKRHGCTAETRKKVQADLQDWVRDSDAAKIYWINGMAGTGKTTIAYSLCEWLEANQRLGASFFCSRVSSSCRNINWIVPTIAYQLARYSPAFQSALCKVLKGDPDAGKLNVVRQFEKLLRDPMLACKDVVPEGVVVVIDALDECEDDYGVRLVLGTLLKLGTNLPLKFFVTSRPEPAVRENMLSPGGYSPAVMHLHDIEQSIVEEDIRKYLTEALSFMSPPPSNEQITQLAERSGKLFIYAATVVRFILPGKGPANSNARLIAMLATDLHSNNEGRPRRKYKELDELYSIILAAAFRCDEFEDEVETMRLVLWTAVCAKEPMTALTMASLLGVNEEQVSSALQPLRSVLHVSEAGGLISTLHASFPDYMLDQLRSGNFHCDQAQHSDLLAHRCFGVMEEQLRFNICSLESSFVFDRSVPDLNNRIKTCISPVLFYACRHWGEHLQLAGRSDALRDRLADFLTNRLLFWMEVLNLRQCVTIGILMLVRAESWLSATNASACTQQQVVDAQEFVARFAAGACNRSTPHIYISALPFCARSGSVYANYWGRTQGLMDVRGTAINQREKAAHAKWMTDSPVYSVAFSPDGARIAFSSDRTLQLRDSRTGDTTAGPFIGHMGSVNSVAFSPNGARVVSGSTDCTIRVWDARTGETVTDPFTGHENSVESVAFSPDGTCIVSGSGDRTIRVWDARTGDIVAGPCKGHTGPVYSVAFSPEGTRIASGSDDHTIRVWNVHTGDIVIDAFEGHTSSVFSVAFSPDGTCIVSGSDDRTIRVWDAHTGDTVAGPYKGHTRPVYSVAFSPDGARVVSGSGDHTVRVWDVCTGDTIAGPFTGHTNWVHSVAFSLDGTRIVSGSDDQTIQVWDARIRDAVFGSPKGHTQWIKAVAFSPDGTRIASSSTDYTIRVWDVCTGDVVAGPFTEHSDSVHSVAFFSDSTLLVSGSRDRTIRVWNVHTGSTVAGPFKGHTGSIYSVAFSPKGTHIISGSSDQTIRVWDVHAGDTTLGPLEGHTGSVRSVVFSPNGACIVSGSDDRTIRVWDARTGDILLRPLTGHTGSIQSVAFSPDSNCIASGSSDKAIRVWDLHSGDTIAGPFREHTNSVESVAFSPDGTCVVSGSEDRTIRVWNARTGRTIAGPFTGHTDLVKSVGFSPDGTRIVSGSYDQTVRVWDVRITKVADSSFKKLPYSLPFSPGDASADSAKNSQTTSLPNIPIALMTCPAQLFQQRDAVIAINSFKYDDDGWVSINHIPLFWVSPDFSALPHPQNLLVIGPDGTVFIDYRHLLLGKRWSECYISQ